MIIKGKFRSGETISSLQYNSKPELSTCNKHSIYIEGDNGTVSYRKAYPDEPLIALLPPSEAANGYADAPIWNQTDVYEIVVTLTADATVCVNSYVDGIR